MRLIPLRPRVVSLLAILAAAALAIWLEPPSALAGEHFEAVPPWLQRHVGNGDGQISEIVLQRARALYMEKVVEGSAKNPCYFAMDATRPSVASSGRVARRFYIICEHDMSFRAISSGYGNGRRLPGANFANGRRCAKNFSNAEGSKLTTGGGYVTAETRTSFKGYYRSHGKSVALVRPFVQFEGEGDTANARERAIGGHSAVLLRGMCLRKRPDSPYANDKGYVPYGRLLNYSSGRSNGCTSWTPEDSKLIVDMIKEQPTTVYIYPESGDIDAVAKAVKAHQKLSSEGLYWNARCLQEIGTPTFWPKEKLEPIIARYRKARPAPPPRPIPICSSG
ncbi:murein L,D-transpeptidase catalytic domain family protein [Methyloceanibacter methanicus]|uniref:murein L,D-transpeptidase catalytic domain family protein n=1 Tax=Methyloceanibacter methanicus TaxID=1774968 RepID=UPI0009F58761